MSWHRTCCKLFRVGPLSGRSPATRPGRRTLSGIGSALFALVGSLFGLSQTQALVVLFVVLPLALAAVIVPLAVWRLSRGPKPVLTSEILDHGLPGEAEIISVRPLGSFLEFRPMVRFVLRVSADSGGVPSSWKWFSRCRVPVMSNFRPGGMVEVRLTPDHSRGAVVWGNRPYAG